jgi:predicted ArsR family transcriptional regulator
MAGPADPAAVRSDSAHPLGPDLDARREISNTGVVKTTGAAPAAAHRPARTSGVPEGASGPSGSDGSTRVAVARLLRDRGPVTTAEVAAELELSGAAVRRHLDVLIAAGEATTRQAPRRGQRGRGRPARLYLLTESGRVRFGHGYDDLAVAALGYLAETGGPGAVGAFARRRAAELVEGHRADIAGQATVAARATALAEVLTERGYAAAARRAGNGVQLCQHHCPVAHVAARFPELCEAETQLFTELLGTHVQRLATIARGDAACTTHVPLGVPDRGDPVTGSPRAERLAPQSADSTAPSATASSTTTTTIPTGRQRV